jgi:hypothetical protein
MSAAMTTSMPGMPATCATKPRPIWPTPTSPIRMGVPAFSRVSSLSLRVTQHSLPPLGAGLYLHPDAGPEELAQIPRASLLEVYLPG